jgi:hypothetical protein
MAPQRPSAGLVLELGFAERRKADDDAKARPAAFQVVAGRLIRTPNRQIRRRSSAAPEATWTQLRSASTAGYPRIVEPRISQDRS